MKEELLLELKDAMKNKDELRKNTITMVRAAILQVEKDEKRELSESDMAAIIAKEVKKRKESIEDFKKAQRQDLVDDLNKEIEILSKYLPKQLTKEEIETLVDNTIKSTSASGPRDMGKVMQALRPEIAGKADGKLVSDIVKAKLA